MTPAKMMTWAAHHGNNGEKEKGLNGAQSEEVSKGRPSPPKQMNAK